MKNQVVLSKRLQMLANMVTKGNRLVDVGCDHGFLSIYLVQAGICPGALAMDVRKGPLAGAAAHVAEMGLGKHIEIRLSDGLKACEAHEADTLVCAGMGGRLMEKILTDSMEKAKQLKELILQPQSELKEFRAFLRSAGFVITDEDAVIDEGKYYFVMKAHRLGEKQAIVSENSKANDVDADTRCLYDTYGEKLLQKKHPVLLDYLLQRQSYVTELKASLEQSGSQKAVQRLNEVEQELKDLENALTYFRV